MDQERDTPAACRDQELAKLNDGRLPVQSPTPGSRIPVLWLGGGQLRRQPSGAGKRVKRSLSLLALRLTGSGLSAGGQQQQQQLAAGGPLNRLARQLLRTVGGQRKSVVGQRSASLVCLGGKSVDKSGELSGSRGLNQSSSSLRLEELELSSSAFNIHDSQFKLDKDDDCWTDKRTENDAVQADGLGDQAASVEKRKEQLRLIRGSGELHGGELLSADYNAIKWMEGKNDVIESIASQSSETKGSSQLDNNSSCKIVNSKFKFSGSSEDNKSREDDEFGFKKKDLECGARSGKEKVEGIEMKKGKKVNKKINKIESPNKSSAENRGSRYKTFNSELDDDDDDVCDEVRGRELSCDKIINSKEAKSREDGCCLSQNDDKTKSNSHSKLIGGKLNENLRGLPINLVHAFDEPKEKSLDRQQARGCKKFSLLRWRF